MDRITKARNALSLLERLRSGLAGLSASASGLLQPTANSLAGGLNFKDVAAGEQSMCSMPASLPYLRTHSHYCARVEGLWYH
jgi:hypothetical protein